MKIGTIGKVWLKIPWNYLWNQPVVVNIEEVHITAKSVVDSDIYDPEIFKQLGRAFKRKALEKLNTEGIAIGGPNSFTEHLLTNLINNLELNVTNVHIRYEDCIDGNDMACGLCIGSITSESTNR